MAGLRVSPESSLGWEGRSEGRDLGILRGDGTNTQTWVMWASRTGLTGVTICLALGCIPTWRTMEASFFLPPRAAAVSGVMAWESGHLISPTN